MARKLVDQEEAARMLGVSVDELKGMRDQGRVYAYRDSGTWKFKVDDLERLIEERKEAGSDWDLLSDSVLVSEKELGKSAETTSSTIIGKNDLPASSESDILISGGSSGVKKGGGSSGVKKPGGKSSGSSDVKLIPNSKGGSDVGLVSDSSPPKSGGKRSSAVTDSNISNLLGDSDSLPDSIHGPGESDLGFDLGSSSGPLNDELALSAPEPDSFDFLGGGDDQLSLEPLSSSSPKLESSVKLTPANDDEELVLGSGSDVTRTGAAESGISLSNPSDVGISLDRDSFELGEDDVISLDPAADVEQATQLRADDDFELEPAGQFHEDIDDSGSQVIALDTEDDMAVGSGGMFESSSPGMAKMLNHGDAGDLGMAGAAAGAAAMAGAAGAMPTYAAGPPEASYSIWNVLGLLACFTVMCLTGMMMFELVRSMWSWNQPYALNGQLLDQVAPMFDWLDKK